MSYFKGDVQNYTRKGSIKVYFTENFLKNETRTSKIIYVQVTGKNQRAQRSISASCSNRRERALSNKHDQFSLLQQFTPFLEKALRTDMT